ncbi:hypothetical protein Q7M_1240 (plasmid) [Borrelia crocidurae str. Achema]|uniref:Uncharacterized protein n=1 Tax=Borrelia crocidurae (strain Achema) TaxID=1155096 RepID=I0FEU1_BORCA|nr:hypothetical protein Q7M_1240 [Borrelia crocidurae str. Achema]
MINQKYFMEIKITLNLILKRWQKMILKIKKKQLSFIILLVKIGI